MPYSKTEKREYGSPPCPEYIDQDTKGNLWFSTQGKGLFKYHPEKQIWKNYIHDHKNPNSLANNQVNCVLIDTNGEMWVGTMNGLCKYNAEEDAFETLPLEIPSHNICSIIEAQRILWLTTTKGLKSIGWKNLYRLSKRIQCFLPPSD